jgi:hypothetical protein
MPKVCICVATHRLGPLQAGSEARSCSVQTAFRLPLARFKRDDLMLLVCARLHSFALVCNSFASLRLIHSYLQHFWRLQTSFCNFFKLNFFYFYMNLFHMLLALYEFILLSLPRDLKPTLINP